MEDYYKILGVEPTATLDEIKKAYRSLAAKNHPDKGGDLKLFQEITAAYNILGDNEKRAEYDAKRQGNQQHGMFEDFFKDAFMNGHFADIFGGGQFRVRRNRDLQIACSISLLDSYLGKDLVVSFMRPNGQKQDVSVNIPAGIAHGMVIRYEGMGDHSIAELSPGNLNITVHVLPDKEFFRNELDLYKTVEITPIEAMIGVTKEVKTITGESMSLNILPGAETGKEYASKNRGFKSLQHQIAKSNMVGRFVIVVKVNTPAITDPNLIKKLKELNDEINQRT